jgi:acetolactate synthase-1/3 small subunit
MRAPFHSAIGNPTRGKTDSVEASIILRLTVRNHPGAMSHICGLFARRAFNLDGIICMPLPEEKFSRMWLRLRRTEKLEQVIKQLEKLHDVVEIRQHDLPHHIFVELEDYFSKPES